MKIIKSQPRNLRNQRHFSLIVQVLVIVALFFMSAIAQRSDDPKKVLMLFSDQPYLTAQNMMDRAMRSTIGGSSVPVEIYAEYQDHMRTGSVDYERALVDLLRQKYKGEKFDLIFADDEFTLRILLKHRSDLFSGVPIVFFVMDHRQVADLDLGSGVTGVWGEVDYEASLDLGLKLHPGTQGVAVVCGVSEWDKAWLVRAQDDFREYESKLKFTYLVGLTNAELQKSLAELPPHTIISYLTDNQDRFGDNHDNVDVLRQISPASSAAIYGVTDAQLGNGIVGGMVLSFEALGTEAANVGLRVLAGESPDAIAPHAVPSVPMFDGRQLRRWGISEASLPAGSVVQYREPTIWEGYGWYIIAALGTFTLETLLIAWMIFLRMRRRKAESDLHENEERMTLAVEAANLGIWYRDLVSGETWASDKWRELFEFDKTEPLDPEAFIAKVHPDDRNRMREIFADVGANEHDIEYRILLPDGGVRWISSHDRIEHDANGKALAVRGASLDITSRKLAEEAAQQLSGRLIGAQEDERMRVARELHDGVAQMLGVFGIELELFKKRHLPVDGSAEELDRLSARVTDLSDDVRRISHDLHPETLQQLGLVLAARSFCRDFGSANEITIEFEEKGVPRLFPKDVSVCLFRIIQESLNNVVKHSNAASARVELTADNGELRLVVSDEGNGFDQHADAAKSSLGLISMRERVRLVNGKLSIRSHPGNGTRITATVPIDLLPSISPLV